MDLQLLRPTNKVDMSWFGARIRLASKAIYQQFGLNEFCTFWTYLLTSKFSLEEHNARNDYMTPNRCTYCGCPIERNTKEVYCNYCSEMINAIISDLT